jgi:hypothetical protein
LPTIHSYAAESRTKLGLSRAKDRATVVLGSRAPQGNMAWARSHPAALGF